MLFSIITPSFNQGKFLTDCIQSVIDQHPAEVEHIIVDAGSTDETLDVISHYPSVTWTSEPDNGMSDGINKGFLKAKGDWIMWLNCDDYLLPGALKKVSDFIANHPYADVIHGDCIYIAENKEIIRRKYDTQVDEWDLLFIGCIIPSTSAFYRRELIDNCHLLDVGYRNCMDWEYYLRLLRAGAKFKYLPEALAHFRWYQDSTTMRHWQRMIDEGLRCQRDHLELTERPSWLGNRHVLSVLRAFFKGRRVMKRVVTHGRLR
jgi:glycosyltransferase involved in cell wall biosynthesis